MRSFRLLVANALSSDVAKWSTGDRELSPGLQQDPCSESPTFPPECLLYPFDVALRRNGETEVLDLQRNELERLKAPTGRIQIGKIHQR